MQRETQVVKLWLENDRQQQEGMLSICRGYKLMGRTLLEFQQALERHYYETCQWPHLPTMMQELLNASLRRVEWEGLARELWEAAE